VTDCLWSLTAVCFTSGQGASTGDHRAPGGGSDRETGAAEGAVSRERGAQAAECRCWRRLCEGREYHVRAGASQPASLVHIWPSEIGFAAVHTSCSHNLTACLQTLALPTLASLAAAAAAAAAAVAAALALALGSQPADPLQVLSTE